MMRPLLPALLGCSLLAACGGAQTTPDAQPAAPSLEHRNLHAVLWTQMAAEYDALAQQAWHAAGTHLEAALADPTWTAVVEQLDDGDIGDLTPAIILDLDETVIDNSGYQAWLIASGASYSSATWNEWCEAVEGTPVPGVVPFLQGMTERGVEIFYVSNRRAVVEDVTITQLEAFGLQTDADHVILRGEVDDGSDKGSRREVVIAEHRVIMLFGDNLGDFVDGVDVGLDGRDDIVAEYGGWWGQRWFMLPNAQYGSWVDAIDDGYQAEGLRDALDAWSGPQQ